MLGILSLSAVTPPYTEFDWFKFKGARGVKLENKDYEVQVDAGERYGIFISKRGVFYVVHEDAPEVVFQTDAKGARSLMGRSDYYKGRVKGKAVNNVRLSTKGKTVDRDPTAAPPAPPVETKQKPTGNAKTFLADIRKQRFHKPRSITYMRMADLPEGRVFYFDASVSFKEALMQPEAWEKFAEKLLVTAMEGQNVEVGAVVQPPTSKNSPHSRAVLMVKVDT